MFDVWAYYGPGLSRASPPVQESAKAVTDGHEVREPLAQFLGLPLDQFVDVGAWRAARPLQRNDLFDLIKAEAEALGLPHEGQQIDRVRTIDTVAGRCAPSGGQNSSLLVEAKRFSRHAGALGYLADQQAVTSHADSVNLYPEGKVKGGQNLLPAITQTSYCRFSASAAALLKAANS